MNRRILFVAMQMSTHTVRWINQITKQGWEVHLFPVNYLPVHHELSGVYVHQPWIPVSPKKIAKTLVSNPRLFFSGQAKFNDYLHNYPYPVRPIYNYPVISRMEPYLNGIKRVRLGESEQTAPAVYGPKVLARLIRELKPTLIHSLEFQHCGYNVLAAKDIIGEAFPKWLATNWGSDIYYYRQFEEHNKQIRRLLGQIDYYSCECERDVELARDLGFEGTVMPVMPNTGGLDMDMVGSLRSVQKPSERKIIMVKGYQHFAGRALTALNAIERCAPYLSGYKVVVFSASPEVYGRVEELQKYVDMDISILPHSDHQTVLRMFSRARIYLGVSISDAISTSMLEAIAMGAFPIQTDTSCCSEWFEDGKGGFIIPSDDPSYIADRIKTAVSDDKLVDNAYSLNYHVVGDRLEKEKLKKKAISFYTQLFESIDNETQ